MKNDIKALPIADIGELGLDTIPEFLTRYEIAKKHTWIFPQIRAHIGAWKPILAENGLYDGNATVIYNCKDNFNKGIWHLLNWSRSDLILGSRLYEIAEYGPLVPIILNAFKVYQNIPYSKWNRDTLNFAVPKDLLDAMLCVLPSYTPEQLLEIRNLCLVYKSGGSKGKMRSPKTTAMLYHTKECEGYDIGSIPRYALVMMTQIWCAHPENRTQHMILDPNDWDNMPFPIIDREVLVARKKETIVDIFPWDK